MSEIYSGYACLLLNFLTNLPISYQFSNRNLPFSLENFLNLDKIRTGGTLSIKDARKGVQSRENLNPLSHRPHISLIEDEEKSINFHAVPEEEASS